MCLAISLDLMTTLVKWQSISRWHYRSTPPHLWSLCNGPKSWNNVSQPTFPFQVLATFIPFHSIFCSQMPLAFHLALGLFRWQSQSIRMDFKIFVKVEQLQHRCFHQNEFQGFKGLVTCFIPFISSGWLLPKVCQKCGYLCKVFDELAIIRGQSLKWS